MQTSLWVPLVVAGLGVLGTVTAGIAGVLITQRSADRREQRIWDRERRREHEHWAREDMVRTFDQRQQAYVAYYKSIRAMARLADQRAKGMRSKPLPEGWADQALADAIELAIFGSASVAVLASDVYFALLQWGTETSLDKVAREELRAKYFKAESELLRLIRLELAVPGADSDQFPV